MPTPPRWLERYKNFEKAFLSLCESQEALVREPTNLFIRDSLIQRYEYTIELAWNMLKDYLEDGGFTGTELEWSRNVVRQAFQSWLVQDGGKWIEALNSRNKTSHAYSERLATEIVHDINETYFFLMRDLYFSFKDRANGHE